MLIIRNSIVLVFLVFCLMVELASDVQAAPAVPRVNSFSDDSDNHSNVSSTSRESGDWVDHFIHIEKLSLHGLNGGIHKLRESKDPSLPLNMTDKEIHDVVYSVFYSYLSYAKPKNVDTWTCKKGCAAPELHGTKIVLDYHKDHPPSEGILAINERLKWLVVAFRGSVDNEDWLNNLETKHVNFPRHSSKKKRFGQVHKGFALGATEAQKVLRGHIEPLLTKYPDYDVVITGHSRGAALASLYATLLLQDNPKIQKRLSVITFGEPRVGDKQYAKYFNSLNLRSYRIVNVDDIVPHLPPAKWGFVHHNREMWIRNVTKNEPTLKACAANGTGEDPDCSNKIKIHDLNRKYHHILRYVGNLKLISQSGRYPKKQ